MSKQILVIPDVHGRTFWKEPLKRINDFDKMIFLGDYLDPYPKEGITEDEAFANFKEIVNLKNQYQDKVTLLLGNHDIHYIWAKEAGVSTRFSIKNAMEYMCYFYEHKSCFQVAHTEIINAKIHLFTHAGINSKWLSHNNLKLDIFRILQTLNSLSQTSEGRTILSQIGAVRGGKSPAGGPFWSDFAYELNSGNQKIDALIYQVVGHTHSTNTNRIGRYAACLDCEMAFMLDKNTGKIEVWK